MNILSRPAELYVSGQDEFYHPHASKSLAENLVYILMKLSKFHQVYKFQHLLSKHHTHSGMNNGAPFWEKFHYIITEHS